jgi:predicted ATP-dependent endonuclease of OLD family
MIIGTVRVRNFRCIKDETLHCEPLTALVGANGSGKSAFLRALDLFYTPTAKYSEEDFYNRDTSEPIVITVTFTNLTDSEKQLFDSHVDRETLTVEKELAWPPGRGSQKYFGSTLQCPDFQHVRAAYRVTEKRTAYQDLVNSGRFSGLPSLPSNASAERIEQALQEWENAHPETLQRARDEGQFFGFKEVGQAHLERYTRFLYVPAVRDASEDATEGKGSVISELMDLVVRSTLAQRDDIRKLLEETQKRYGEIMTELTELQTLAGRMTETLNTFAPGAQIQLNWLSDETVQIAMPKADVKVVEDGYPSAVERTGHGVQRAFILTALQHLALAQAPETRENEAIQQHPSDAPMSSVPPEGNASTPTLPNLILGIEEPELYQHPSRQRHLARVLFQLATGGIEGVAQSAQVIYTTHSPLLVDLQRFHQIRLLRKEEVEDGKPKQTKVFQATIEQVTRVIEKADGVAEGSYSAEGVYARLQTLMTPWTNEGFFANVVVLVEGEDDRAAILGMAKAMDYEFESMDIAVIPCMGKTNLHKAAAIFMTLKISTYVVWDSDEGKKTKPEDNHRLLRLFGAPLEEDYPGKVTDNFACFKRDMDTTLREELTPDTYDSLLEQCKGNFGYDDNKQARKNPLVVKTIIEEASKRDKRCTTLEEIVTAVLKLRDSSIHQGVITNHVSSG